ncbi:MAG: sensor histidine kinase [Acidimicrobiales bacterium]
MTFRNRVVTTATAAVVVVVIAVAAAAYVASRNALLSSVDSSLAATANLALSHRGVLAGGVADIRPQVVDSHGHQVVDNGLPVGSTVSAVARGRESQAFVTVTVAGQQYREIVVYLPPGTAVDTQLVPYFLTNGGALQLATPITGLDHELAHLGLELLLFGIGGVALALLLALLISRAAMAPLNDLISSVDEVAATTDVSKRLDPGSEDELGTLRRAFNRLLTAVEESRESQRQLVLDAGHELRTPLTSLRTNLEVIRRVDELSPEDREVLVNDVLAQLEELTTLVADLSELARGEQAPTEAAPFRLDRVVEDTVALAATHGRSRGVRLDLACQPSWVVGRRDRVARAVGNLVDNAVKWSPDGGVVEVGCVGGELAVRDHGPGIDPADLPHIFDRFYRAPAARGRPGSGLGLAIVAQVAESEGGSAWAGNADGGGALFRLRFPQVAPPTGADAQEPADD